MPLWFCAICAFIAAFITKDKDEALLAFKVGVICAILATLTYLVL